MECCLQIRSLAAMEYYSQVTNCSMTELFTKHVSGTRQMSDSMLFSFINKILIYTSFTKSAKHKNYL